MMLDDSGRLTDRELVVMTRRNIFLFISGAAKQFRREWFQGDGMVRRKNLPIEYNP